MALTGQRAASGHQAVQPGSFPRKLRSLMPPIGSASPFSGIMPAGICGRLMYQARRSLLFVSDGSGSVTAGGLPGSAVRELAALVRR